MSQAEAMQAYAGAPSGASPEAVIDGLTRRLRNHQIRDFLLLFTPPALAWLYLFSQLYRAGWIGESVLIIAVAGATGVGILALARFYSPRAPSHPSAARLIDAKAAAEDRFLTLATVERSSASHAFLAHLRGETSVLLGRVDLRHDFPYEIKRSFYWSLTGSALAVLLFHLLLPMTQSVIVAPAPALSEISQLAERMGRRPGLQQLARDLQSLASKLQDPSVTPAQKQQAIEQAQNKIEEQQKNPEQKETQDILAEAQSTLKEIEQQSAKSQPKEQETGGSVQSNIPQGEGEAKQSQGSGGETKGDVKAQKSDSTEQGKSAQGEPKEQGSEKSQSPQAGQEKDKNRPGEDQGKEMKGKTEGGSEEQLGKSRSEGKGRSEENPQGAPPAERFTKPGEEGKGGLKGARYVTVQLPEELAGEGKAQSTAAEGKNGKVRPKVPVSNVPLPAHVPDAPSEKQHLPLEYRGVIR
jgi:hypothetical protein